MLATERQKTILEMLEKNKTVEVTELSECLSVSEMTIRRDLDKLEQAGLLTRTFGGATVTSNPVALQLSFVEKVGVFEREKQAIAKAAASLIHDGDTVGLVAGTTCFQIAKNFPARENVTVVTNAINIAMEFANRGGIKLIVTSGYMLERSFALVGPFAECILEQIHINKLFLGATGVSLDRGVTTQDLLEASMYKAMIRSAEQVVVVADHTKMGVVSLAPILPISKVNKLITDSEIDPLMLQKLEETGCEICVADID